MIDRAVLRALATIQRDTPVVSVYARTDPRDPANTSETPGWQIALRNGLRAISERVEAGDDRDLRQALRALHERIEAELVGLEPAERGRSVAWFFGLDGELSERLTLQLPVARDRVVLDERPFVSLLAEVADHGAATGVVLVDGERVRLLHLEQGEVHEPEGAEYLLELGDWRTYGGSAGGSAERGVQTTSHQEHYEARVEEQRHKLFERAAAATAARLGASGWERVVLVAEHQVEGQFRAALPVTVEDRLVATVDLNLAQETPSAVAGALEPVVHDVWRTQTADLVAEAHTRALAGGAAALGLEETVGALAEGRVAHLVLDPERDFAAEAGTFPIPFDGPPELLGERAVEAAIATDAEITALSSADDERLDAAGGILALLRY